MRLLLSLLLCLSPVANAETLRVVTDIPPVHALVAAVMEGAGTPTLLLKPGASPHTAALRPSEARALQDADILVWIGPELTPPLSRAFESLAPNAVSLPLLHSPGTHEHEVRDGAGFEEEHDHDHGDHQVDPHAWLDPENARIWLGTIAEALAKADPENAALYTSNAAQYEQDLASLIKELTRDLKPLQNTKFIVSHDAFQYFEARFTLPASGTIAASDATAPSAAEIAKIRETMQSQNVTCILAEPGFNANLLRTVTEGSTARSVTIDPLGRAHTPGPGLYKALIRDMGAGILSCTN